jgi:hypothetical protein
MLAGQGRCRGPARRPPTGIAAESLSRPDLAVTVAAADSEAPSGTTFNLKFSAWSLPRFQVGTVLIMRP